VLNSVRIHLSGCGIPSQRNPSGLRDEYRDAV
jgi:hypothetical protein